MDLRIAAAIVMLIVWAIGALVMQGPGWIHLLLTLGVSLLIYGIVHRSSGTAKQPPSR
jgi:predicted phage tail protein